MQFIEQFLQKSHLPHSLTSVFIFFVLKASDIFWLFLIFKIVKKGQGKAIEASGFNEIVVDAEEHQMTLLNPPKDWNL